MRQESTGMAGTFFLAFIFLGGAAFGAHSVLLELPLKKIYVPHTGFDDNDRVEAVVEGELPNPCFTLAETKVEPAGDGGYRIRQMAHKRTTGACGSGDLIDDPSPFTSVVPLGQLDAHEYRLEIRNELGAKVQRRFAVDVAKLEAIDEFPYAVVRGVEQDEAFAAGADVRMALTGLFTLSCQKLKEPVDVQIQDDVILMLPVVEQQKNVPCEPVQRPFRHTVKLAKKLAPGNYLTHVRSRGGNAVYRAFTVWR